MLQHCASTEDQPIAQALEQAELLTYLRQITDPGRPALESVLAQTEAIGDPARPTREQCTALRWLESAFTQWERDYPLEEPVAAQLRQLKPLVATLAITDPSFMQPGVHPAHQLLDTAQASAIGWQERLGRAGEQLQRHLSTMCETLLHNFLQGNTDLSEPLAQLLKFAERDRAKLKRLEQRLVATEEGQTKTAQVRLQAAQMINRGLRQYTATAEIGELIKGPWYASAQLVLLKFGAQSPQWQQVAQTTEELLQSLSIQEDDNAGRQQLFEVATQLPKSIKRWLMSLHHDADALADAVRIIESAHLQMMRKQALDLQEIDILPEIPVRDADSDEGNFLAVAAFETGQWFLIETPKGSLRAQLVLKKSQEQQLLFANQAGIKTLMLDFQAFTGMLAQEQAIPLHSGASFSMSLAQCAGITTADMPTTDNNTPQAKSRNDEQEPQREQERLEQEERQGEQQRLEQEERQREQQRLEQEERQREQQRLEQEERQREQQRLEQEERQREQQRLEQEERQREQQRLEQEERQREQQRLEQEERQREQQRLEQGERQREQERLEQEGRQREQQRLEQEGRQREQERLEQEERDRKASELSLPMGAWLQFMDEDSPLIAKLALHRREDDVYIFVDRKGTKLRELNRDSLLALIKDKLVDILDAESSLQQRIDRARDKLRDRGDTSGGDAEPHTPEEYTAAEKRQHPRFPLERRAFVELVAADTRSEGDSAGEVVACYTVDASRGGLRVRIHHPLAAGSILQIAIDLSDDDTLYLAAEVRWCELGPISGQGWIAGFILMDAVDSDQGSWQQLLSTLESKGGD